MIVADNDHTTPSEKALAVFQKAGTPKEVLTYNGDHYDIYDDETIRNWAIEKESAFLRQHLTA
jgi:fermentation-respiration switch protein FrsA (DUF1100 family)